MTKFRRIGNSLGLIVPAHVADRMGVEEGDEAVFDIEAGRLVVSPKKAIISDEEFEDIVADMLDRYDAVFRRLASM